MTRTSYQILGYAVLFSGQYTALEVAQEIGLSLGAVYRELADLRRLGLVKRGRGKIEPTKSGIAYVVDHVGGSIAAG